jgi:type I restriction enzyme S subunit
VSAWQDKTWGDLVTLEYGKSLTGYEDSNGRYRVFGTNGEIGHCDEPLCPHATVIIGRKGAYRGVHYSAEPCFVIDTAFYLKAKADLDVRWAYYQLLTQDINGMDSGSAIPSTSRGDFYYLPVTVPPPAEQRAIARVLGALDDKIELNRRMNETLEALARALFQRMKDEGGAGTLGDIAENPRRAVDPTEVDPQTPYIGLEHMPRRSIALSEWGTAGELESGKAHFRRGEILFGKLRPYFHKVGVAPLDGVCSTDILTIVPKKTAWFGLLLGHLSSKDLIDHTDACSTGTKMPRVSWSDIARYEIALPPEPVAAKLTGTIQPLVERIIANIHEFRTLAALRDALLPKLLSGEVRVKAAENHMEALT